MFKIVRAGMAFMTKKKKYRFQVELCLEELLEVPFVSAVLFAKLRLLDGGFQDHSSRVEVAEHAIKWSSHFSFTCKMTANATTGVLEPCILRISIRKECKGGRSFTKLGFVDLNLAEFAGAGEISRKALLEGYDSRRRQDNSMLRFSLNMNMLAGDILFKVPSPSSKHKAIVVEDSANEPRLQDDFSSGSLAGSIASASSGFGSLPKKRPQLLQSELVLSQFSNENVPITIATDIIDPPNHVSDENLICEPGHSRNSSNTSQMSKASGYSSIHSHSRQSSSGDSGHIRDPQKPKWLLQHPSQSPPYLNIKNSEGFSTPQGTIMPQVNGCYEINGADSSLYFTPKGYQKQISNTSSSSADDYKTPDCSILDGGVQAPLYDSKFNTNYPTPEIYKHCSCSVVEHRIKNMSPIIEIPYQRKSDNSQIRVAKLLHPILIERCSLDEKNIKSKPSVGVLRSKSDFEIPRRATLLKPESIFHNFTQKSDALLSFLTPRSKRKVFSTNSNPVGVTGGQSSSTPKDKISNSNFKVPTSPILRCTQRSLPGTRTTSPTLIKSRLGAPEGQTQLNSAFQLQRNPSSGSLVLSETGSLDRAKAALERRKKTQSQEPDLNTVSDRVEGTRVNPGDLIEELLKTANLEPTDDSAETSGLQLFIAKDGTAALGNYEVKSQMSTGVHSFKQVVVEDKR